MENEIRDYVGRVYEDTYAFIAKYLTVKCRNCNDIHDLLHNTYADFLETIKKHGIEHIRVPKYYLLKSAKHQISKYYKDKDIKFYSIDSSEYEEADDNFLLEDVSEDKLLYESIWSAIEQSDHITLKIFILKIRYDMTLSEISKETKIPLSTVKSKYYRTLASIKSIISKEE